MKEDIVIALSLRIDRETIRCLDKDIVDSSYRCAL